MAEVTEVSKNKMFGGWQKVFSHTSSELKCDIKFAIYLPPQTEDGIKVPVLYWLSGLTCTEQNFITKDCAQRHAARDGIIIVCPDTSPRGCNIEGEDDSYDFGTGAGFYVNATEEKWKTNYRMDAYVTQELPKLIKSKFPADPNKQSIIGHSAGGHGALALFLRNPGMYQSVSVLAPICNPMACPWGQKAFEGYLGNDKETWKEYDACHLVRKYQGPPNEILIDQGTADNFLAEGQLLPNNFVAACAGSKMSVNLRMQEDYDHGHFFVSTFIGDHMKHHAKFLKK